MQSAQDPAIAVVLPTFNGAAFVRESVESVLAQDTGDFELIVCDDGSTDETWSILQQYAGPRCRLLRNESNRGLFPTLNRLMGETRARWVHLWSQDDRMLPSCLRRTLEFAGGHPEVAMIYSRMRFIDEHGVHFSDGKADSTPAVVNSLFAARIMYFFGSISGNIANVSLRRDAFQALGPFREDMKVSGDWEYWTRLSESYPIGFLNEALIELRAHGGQFSRQPLSGLQFIRENREIKERLYARLAESDRPAAQRYTRWVVQVNAFHHAIRCVMRRDLGTAFAVLGILRKETSIVPLAIRWLVSANGRALSPPRLSVSEETVSFEGIRRARPK